MKKRNVFYALPIAAILSVSSCRKASAPSTSAAPASNPTAETSAPAAFPTPAVTVTPTERAAKLGFAQMLTADTETVMLFQNGKSVIDGIKSSEFYKSVTKDMPEIEATLEGDGGSFSAMDILGNEFFLATGKGTAQQASNLYILNERSTYHTIKMAISSGIAELTGEEDSDEMMDSSEKMIKDLVNDPKFGLAWWEKAEMPPIYFGCKTTSENAERVKNAFAMVATGLVEDAPPFVAEFEFKVSGHDFKGVRIAGEELVKFAEEQGLEEMKEALGETAAEDLLKGAAKKNLIIASGTVNGYELILLGSRPEDFQFAATPAESLAASSKLGFVDPYVDKEQVALLYSDKSVLESAKSGSLSVICDAVRDGLAGNGKIDTREIESLLEMVSDKEKDLLAMNQPSDFGMLAMLDQGFRIETFGGTSLPNLDATKTNQLGALGQGEGVAMFANWTSNPAYDKAVRGYLEATVHAVYAAAKSAAALEIEDESFMQFKQGFAMFDETFRADALALWKAVGTEMAEGLGTETAMIVDLNGEMPPLPNVPQELVNDGICPRISIISPVVDRSKLATSWDSVNASGQNIMKSVSQMMGSEQAMPKPMSSNNNDLTSWFFAAPFFTDDFTPSVTLSDKWFVMSTSKKHAGELAKAADSSKSGVQGASMTLNFESLAIFAEKWLNAVDKNKDSVFAGNEFALTEFGNTKEMSSSFIKTFKEFDNLNIHVRKEGGVSRSTLHFKTK